MIRKERSYHQNHEIIFPITKEKFEYKTERLPTRERYATPTALTPFLLFRLFVLQVYIASLMPRRLDNLGNNNWHRLWESNKKSHRRCARTWLERLSSSPLPPIASTVPLSTFSPSDTFAMTNNPVIQSPKDQFLHWRQDMERK